MAHCDIDSANPPARRIGALVLIRNAAGAVLMVKPTYRPGWQLPGGGANQGEPIPDAAARELKEETGLTREVSHFFALDQVPASDDGTSAEGFNIVCDGGTMDIVSAGMVAIPETAVDELSDIQWVPLDKLSQFAMPYQERRIRQAMAAAVVGARLPLLMLGEPACRC